MQIKASNNVWVLASVDAYNEMKVGIDPSICQLSSRSLGLVFHFSPVESPHQLFHTARGVGIKAASWGEGVGNERGGDCSQGVVK